ncbi:hypothetical protein MUW83_11935, partial [Enterococcus faecium]|uniref:hypothetical protein n=1 Tax=Enterococcus faecium TaxID=1352 RepID=UPI0023B960BB
FEALLFSIRGRYGIQKHRSLTTGRLLYPNAQYLKQSGVLIPPFGLVRQINSKGLQGVFSICFGK